MIPEGVITHEHVLSALKQMDTDGVPWHRESVKFELLYEGKGYPPKYAVSLAFKDATGNELDPSNFSGGEETKRFLMDLGFKTELKRNTGVYLLLISNDESGWSDRDGHSYHFADTVANYKKLQPGAEFLLSRRLYLGKKIIGVGQIDSVVDEPSNDHKHHFRALVNDYRPLLPPRVLTPELEKEIQSLPNFNAQHSIRVITGELFNKLAQPARAWIFQANPAYYDVRSAVRTLKEDTWTVGQYRDQIGPGDRVYLWESGPSGGIVGDADIIDKPSIRQEFEESKRFVKDPDRFQKEALRVAIRIDRNRHAFLSRNQIITTSALAGLSILKFANNTNFLVTTEEAAVIETLMSRKLIWRRTAPRSYDLLLDNPQDLDNETLGRLFQTFITSECRPQPNFNQYLREDLDRWVQNPSAPLVSAAYVSLSNWFLTGQSSMLASPRSAAARALWNYLFSYEPKERMSSPESGQNHVIIPEQFERWWQEQVRSQGTMTNPTSEPNSIAARFAELCSATFLPQEFFEDCEKLFTTKKQLILQGAPGTGKTFVAKHLANWWAGDPARTMLVQFHESYGYEDFVHGIKPIDPRDGIVGFAPHDGILVQLSEEARKYPDHRYVLIIDEINRGKPARVFGELLYLLEYRNESVILQSGKKFSLPPNLYLVGTMNTVDKSIALVDYALRRRFGFVTLQSVMNGKSVVLGPWLRREGVSNSSEIEAIFVTLNKLIAAKGEDLMIGHSYFMLHPDSGKGQISEKSLQFVWRYYILPLVGEYEYELNASKIAEKYGLETVRRLAQAEFTQA